MHEQAEHRIRAYGEPGKDKGLGERVWVGGCVHGIVLVRTDASDDAEVITDAFRGKSVTVGADAAGHRRLRGCVGLR